ncbi:hypothetical protein [Chitinilyticum piscinae]|uniref:Uncharacterized protein n=1 Tax=Chitinilyticum piscinae TaxID=2866724 RepID=A0A8J7FIP6_9NEIS|nr:hypothetical protein [Chitinilyticum piscinae]MBE9608157.1 hypothetical protein [Chitinilyticum piscinae]
MAIAEWKYKSPKSKLMPDWGWSGWLLAAIVLIAGWWLDLGPAGVLPVTIYWWVSISSSGKLLVSSRYLLAGNDLVYFANVSRVQREARRLLLTHLDGRMFVLEAERFPSNARKPDKIARHQADKFARVSGRLLEHIRAAAPAAEIRGVAEE